MVRSTTPHLNSPPIGTVNITKLTGIMILTEKNSWNRSDSETHPHLKRLPIYNLSDAPQPHPLYDMIPFKTSNTIAHIVFPVSIGFLVCTTAVPPGIIVIHRPLGHLGAHYMHENAGLKSMHKSIRRLSIGAAVPSRDPHCCKRHWCARVSCRHSSMYREEFCRASSSRRKNLHHVWVSYNTSFLFHFCA